MFLGCASVLKFTVSRHTYFYFFLSLGHSERSASTDSGSETEPPQSHRPKPGAKAEPRMASRDDTTPKRNKKGKKKKTAATLCKYHIT